MNFPPTAEPVQITPLELKQRLDAGEKFRLIDVREPREYEIARLDGAELIPMREVPNALDRLCEAEGAPLVVICHHGVRSQQVVNWLREQGLTRCLNLAGGIDRWSREVDPTVPRYR